MARPPHPGPTERELTLLKLLWEHGPSTVRQLHQLIHLRPRPAYTSVQSNLQGMLDKGYVHSRTDQHAHVYAATVTRDEVERRAVSDLIRRVFDGSALRLFTAALHDGQTTPAELKRLQALLDESRDD